MSLVALLIMKLLRFSPTVAVGFGPSLQFIVLYSVSRLTFNRLAALAVRTSIATSRHYKKNQFGRSLPRHYRSSGVGYSPTISPPVSKGNRAFAPVKYPLS